MVAWWEVCLPDAILGAGQPPAAPFFRARQASGGVEGPFSEGWKTHLSKYMYPQFVDGKTEVTNFALNCYRYLEYSISSLSYVLRNKLWFLSISWFNS